MIKRVLLGDNARIFLKRLEKVDWNPQYLSERDISGGIIDNTTSCKIIYTAFNCCTNETFVEDFDDIVEAAKYASGIMAKTINGEEI